MLIFEKNLGPVAPADGCAVYSVELTAHERSSFRLHFFLEGGMEAGIILPRGSRLPQTGDLLQSADGSVLLIKAKAEEVVQAKAPDYLTFARACYHLGNRHLPLQIDDLALYFEKDPVIEDLCRQLGLELTVLLHPFEPEGGAYGGHHHHHHEEAQPAVAEQHHHHRHFHVPNPAPYAEQD